MKANTNPSLFRAAYARSLIASSCFVFAAISSSSAQGVILDRGLPKTNINIAAGANRSNVVIGNPTQLVGDDFTLPTTGLPTGGFWSVTGLRLWLVPFQSGSSFTSVNIGDYLSSLTLYFSNNSSQLAPLATTNLTTGSNVGSNSAFSISRVFYPTTTSDYEGFTGVLRPIFQVDLTVPAFAASGGSKWYFAVGGVSQSTGSFLPGVHASNAALDGVPSDSADNLFASWDPTSLGSYTQLDATTTNPQLLSNPVDVNVQVIGVAVPEPSAVAALFAVAALAWVALRRRRA